MREYQGTHPVNPPALRLKAAETLSHTALSTGHVMLHAVDVAIVFNSGNAPLIATMRARATPAAVHMDGLEAERAECEGIGTRYYAWAERSAIKHADAIIANARAIQDHIEQRYGLSSEYLPHGAPLVHGPTPRLAEMGLESGRYH